MVCPNGVAVAQQNPFTAQSHLTLFHFCQTYKKGKNQDDAFVSRRSRRCQLTPGRFRPPLTSTPRLHPCPPSITELITTHYYQHRAYENETTQFETVNCRFNRRPRRPHQYHRVRVAALKSWIKQIFCCFGELRLHNDLAELPLLDGR